MGWYSDCEALSPPGDAQGVVADVHQPTVCDVIVDGARVSNVGQTQLETVHRNLRKRSIA